MSNEGYRGHQNQDWREGKTVAQCNKYMLENELHCNITFIVGVGELCERISAHTYMLINRSEVFEAMLVGPLHEHSTTIDLPDVTPVAFRKLLEYIYYDNTRIDENEACEVLYVARKYLVTGLIKRCLDKLKAKMSADNVCLILSYADDPGTVELCLVYIFRYPAEVLKSDGFKELTVDHVKTIISSNRLSVPEEEIFEAVLSWSERECQRQNIDILPENQYLVLGDILKLIRYGRMDRHYFLNVCKKFLPRNEYIEILEQLASEITNLTTTEEPIEPPVSSLSRHANLSTCGGETRPKQFSNPHIPMEVLDSPNEASGGSPIPSVFSRRHEQFDIIRFRKHDFASGKTYDRQTPDSISFIVSVDVDLQAIYIYGSCGGEGEYQIHLEIFEDLNGHLSMIHSSDRELSTDGSAVPHKLTLHPPVRIERDRVYTVKALIQGPPSYFGTNGNLNVIKNAVSVYFITHDDFGLNLTSAEGGQFPGLLFDKPT